MTATPVVRGCVTQTQPGKTLLASLQGGKIYVYRLGLVVESESILVRNDRRWALFIALVCVATLPALAFFGGGDDDMPTFRSDQKRESKEFVTKVGEVIVMAARSRPKKIELTDFAYTTPKPNRKELTLKMTYTGAVTRVKFTVEIAMLLDTEDKDRWEVLNIRYSDSNKSPVPYSEKKVQNLIKQLNK